MNISRDNYELFFIDYFDGNLSAELTAELFLFLEENPDLKSEFESFENVQLSETDEEFPLRESIKRGEVNKENLSWFMVADIEGDLSAGEQQLLADYIRKNPEAQQESRLFGLTKLQPGTESYPDKAELKKTIPFRIFSTRNISYAAAAMILLSIIAGSVFNYIQTDNKSQPQVAEVPVSVPGNTGTDGIQEHEPERIINTPSETNSRNKVVQQLAENGKSGNTKTQHNKPKAASGEENLTDPVNRSQINTVELLDADIQLTAEMNVREKEEPASADVNTGDVALADNTNQKSSDEYMTVWEAIRQSAEKNIRKATDDEPVASAEENKGKPVRLISLLGKGIEKVSNDKVSVDTQYGEDGKLSAFQFTAGKLKVGRSSGF